MKKGFLIVFSVVIAFAACKPKDEKTRAVKAEIGGFEKDWEATNEMMNNLGLEIMDKIAVDTLHSEGCRVLKGRYLNEQNDWNVASKAFEDWKTKFDKGEVKSEKAIQTLKDFKATLEEYNTKIEQWTALLEMCVETTSSSDSTNTENID